MIGAVFENKSLIQAKIFGDVFEQNLDVRKIVVGLQGVGVANQLVNDSNNDLFAPTADDSISKVVTYPGVPRTKSPVIKGICYCNFSNSLEEKLYNVVLVYSF